MTCVMACDDSGSLPPSGMGTLGPIPTSRPSVDSRPSPFVWTDVSRESGITTVQVNGDPSGKWTILESLGQGAAVLDADGDGDLDVFLCNGDQFHGKPAGAKPRTALWLQVSPFKFVEAPSKIGCQLAGWFQGAYAVDLDANGHTDLFLTGWNRTVLLMNRGGTFVDETEPWGASLKGWTSGCAFFDADQDGDLDLFVARYVTFDLANPPNGGKPCDWRGLAVACGPHGLIAQPDSFLRNVGGRFDDATTACGFDKAPPSYGLGVVAFDLEGDGDMDLYVANDSQANHLWENQGGTFVNVADRLGCDLGEGGRPQAGMGVEVADLDMDGRPDIMVTNFEHDTNTLYLSRISGRVSAFLDASSVSGFGPPSFPDLAWGIRSADFDRDGLPDVMVANGHIYPQVDGTPLETSYRQSILLLHHEGVQSDGLPRFRPTRVGGFVGVVRCGRGLLLADFDDDGDDDALMTVLDGTPALGRNDTPGGHWIGVELRGKGQNPGAIGAKLEVTDSNGRTHHHQRTYGAGFYSTSDTRMRIGLGSGKVVRGFVRFPGGKVVELPTHFDRQYLVVDEATGGVTPRSPR